MGDRVGNVVVVGGGTAGWLTAAVLAAEHGSVPGASVQVTVVESPDVPIIGVGEGTWPSLRDTLRRIGVSESEFVRACDAAFKQGSRFDGWVTGAADDRYYHPFALPHGHLDAGIAEAWLARHDARPFAAAVSAQPHLCAHGKAPKQAATPEFAAVANYGYHLDAGKFSTFLRDHCVQRLGVRHVAAHVAAVESDPDGDIAALQLAGGERVHGDLFVDCTGTHALLIGAHFNVPLLGQRHVLFNDRALAMQVPYADPADEIASQTTATAQDGGWIWDIGLPTRRGVGHVYSSAHASDDGAEAALRAYVAATAPGVEPPPARRLRFEPGYRERFWHRNCVAVGLSAGFVEPLEASAIALVELSAHMLSEQLPPTRAAMDIVARRFNDAFTYRWERTVEFLKLHYVLTRRTGSAFWRDHVEPDSVPDRLGEQLALWRHRPPSRHDLQRGEEVFPSASYQYVLYGMGFRPEPAAPRRSSAPDVADPYFRETAQLAGRMLSALPGHRQLLTHISRHGLPRI